jgi:flagellar protein FlaG
MAIQITNLAAGSGTQITVAAMQESARQKRQAMPIEQNHSEIQAVSSGDSSQTASNLLQATGLTFDSRLEFVLDQESREITVKVVDNRTDEVIRVLPPEELQRLHSKIRETSGSLFNREV